MEELEYDEFTYDKTGELYGISIEEERSLWKTEYIDKYIYIAHICPKCDIGNLKLVKFKSTCNPLKGDAQIINARQEYIFDNFPYLNLSPKFQIKFK